MLPNIRRHSVMVAKVALQLVSGLTANSKLASIPDRDLVLAGALLHDIAKTPCLQTGCDHARAGAEICQQLGYPKIAQIVEQHVVLLDHDDRRRKCGVFSACEIIYYADKRVMHEDIVSLERRLEYILERYGEGVPEIERRIRENFGKCVHLEQALFRFLSFSPAQMEYLVLQQNEDGLSGLLTAGLAV